MVGALQLRMAPGEGGLTGWGKSWEPKGPEQRAGLYQDSVLISIQAAETPHCLTQPPRGSAGHGEVCASTYLLPLIHPDLDRRHLGGL